MDLLTHRDLKYVLCFTEKLQAIASPWAEWIGELEAQHVTSDGGLSTIIDWDTSRGRDFQCLAQLVYCCDGLPQQLLPTNQKLEKWLIRIDKPTPAFKTQINSVLSAFWYIASTKGLDKGFTEIGKRVAPVEFVFIGSFDCFQSGMCTLIKLRKVYFFSPCVTIPTKIVARQSSACASSSAKNSKMFEITLRSAKCCGRSFSRSPSPGVCR